MQKVIVGHEIDCQWVFESGEYASGYRITSFGRMKSALSSLTATQDP
jgi:hypothetical protein